MLQEVDRGGLLGGGTDMVEYLAGETRMEIAYAPAASAQVGNAILTSRAHSGERTIELPEAPDGPARSALAIDFMGATYASAQLSGDQADAAAEQAATLASALAGTEVAVVGADLGDALGTEAPDSSALDTLADAGWDALAHGSATVDGEEIAGVGVIIGRAVTLDEVAVVATVGSDHAPLIARVTPLEPAQRSRGR
ncbi:hypothetical protein GCM10025876_10330 [Demequina litorisediminis]|uniref:Uncharacterized protein n=1 Tax=Demequina litorisediminis TaxID=1849022 RepID=A0ABQ6IDM6_9MICO|nr:hypothetical protein GCM10025876_10330 [Demequina litorisediminis]